MSHGETTDNFGKMPLQGALNGAAGVTWVFYSVCKKAALSEQGGIVTEAFYCCFQCDNVFPKGGVAFFQRNNVCFHIVLVRQLVPQRWCRAVLV